MAIQVRKIRNLYDSQKNRHELKEEYEKCNKEEEERERKNRG
jgi:hypothetical protein